MSLKGLRNFNAAYGFLPLHRKTTFGETTGKRENLLVKLIASIPVLGVVFAHKRKEIMDINLSSRVVLSTACLFPLVFALDVLATLVTQPLGRYLEGRQFKQHASESYTLNSEF